MTISYSLVKVVQLVLGEISFILVRNDLVEFILIFALHRKGYRVAVQLRCMYFRYISRTLVCPFCKVGGHRGTGTPPPTYRRWIKKRLQCFSELVMTAGFPSISKSGLDW